MLRETRVTRRSRMEKGYHCSKVSYWARSTLGASFRMVVPPVLIRTSAECNCSKQTREVPNSRHGSPDSRFDRETGRKPLIPDSAGIGNRETPRFRIRPGPVIAVPGPGIGVPRHAGDFLVSAQAGRKCRVVPISTTAHASVRCLRRAHVAQMAFACI